MNKIINTADSEFFVSVGDVEFSCLLVAYPISLDNSEAIKPLHYHDYYELYYLEEGNLLLQLENDNIQLTNNNFSITSCLVKHRILGVENSKGLKVGFTFKKKKNNTGDYEKFKNVFSNLSCKVFFEDSQVKTFYTILTNNMNNLVLLKATFICLIYWLYDHLSLKNEKYEIKSEDVNAKDIIMNALMYRYNSDIKASDVANNVYLCARQVNRICYKMYGRTFLEQKNYLRIEQAKKLLINSDETITEIAMNLGFSSSGNFYNVFKKFENISPKEFRNKYKK